MIEITGKIKKFNWQKYASFLALVFLFVLSSFLSPYFLKPQNIINIMRQVSYTGIIALGMTICYNYSRNRPFCWVSGCLYRGSSCPFNECSSEDN